MKNEIQKLFSNQEYDKVILESQKITDKKISEEIESFVGLSYFQLHEFSKAVPYLKHVAEKGKDPLDWFNLATSSIMAKLPQEGMKAFEKSLVYLKEHGTKEHLPAGHMHFYVMQALRDTGEYDLAFSQLEILKNIYSNLGITDDHFVYTRGFPFLGNVLSAAKEILGKQTIVQPKKWLEDFAGRLDEEGQEQIRNLIKELAL